MSTNEEEGPVPGLSGLKLDREPARDLWPGIDARLAPRCRPARLRWAGYALAASLVGAVALGLWRQVPLPVEAPAAPVPVARAGQVMPEPQALLKANLAIVKDAESQLQHALELDPESESLRRLLALMQQQRGALKTRLAHEKRAQET